MNQILQRFLSIALIIARSAFVVKCKNGEAEMSVKYFYELIIIHEYR